MPDEPAFEPPNVTDDDILWASHLLDLPDDAFYGKDGADPRQEVLNSMNTIDVAACPGSGKTTLLVAKLAILAKTWQYRTRGICVLSHTNAARHQIEARLGNTAVGRRLLSYPHFIGTIHGFANDFLAVPWLRSIGYPVKLIDTEFCERRRWRKLNHKWRFSLQKKFINESDIRIADTSFALARKKGTFPFADHTATYQNTRKACRETTEEGYHCHDDMFLWARDMITKLPWVIEVIRDRFPLLFVDEAQDNSEDQSSILHRIFIEGESIVTRQRFGDENQAIFDFIEANEATTDAFPGTKKKELPNSHRFGQTIADLADPLGLVPYPLLGLGPKKALSSGSNEGPHTIFLFDDDNLGEVLDAYAQLLIETFSEQELQEGTFTAVGLVHKPKEDNHRPRHVGHYWPDYDPELSSAEPKPRTFLQYVIAGQARAEANGEAHFAVENIAQGILRLAGMTESKKTCHRRRYCHRYIMKLLEDDADLRGEYESLIVLLAVRKEAPKEKTWDEVADSGRRIAENIAGTSLSRADAADFLKWIDRHESDKSTGVFPKSADNMYRYSKDSKAVAIRVGSIHSVKGQTHTATLVLETHWHTFNLEDLWPWLAGTESGAAGAGIQQKSRLKVHYVAMTRPTHLLCLAMKRSVFEKSEGELDQGLMNALGQHGWHISPVD